MKSLSPFSLPRLYAKPQPKAFLTRARAFHVSHRANVAPSAVRRAVAQAAVGSYSGEEEGDHVLSSPSALARKISARVLPKLPRPDVRKVLVVGSGGLSI